MSSNTRITRSKGPSDGTSLPPYTRPKRDTNAKADKAESMMTPTQQQPASDLLNNTVGHSPFARPSSRAGTSTPPASVTQPPCSPFARPGSRAGSSTELTDNMQNSPTSSVNSDLFPRDLPARTLLRWIWMPKLPVLLDNTSNNKCQYLQRVVQRPTVRYFSSLFSPQM